ncbi:MAG: hypothetical protein ACOYJW_02490 [Candidatus Omnitrophota bacterium]
MTNRRHAERSEASWEREILHFVQDDGRVGMWFGMTRIGDAVQDDEWLVAWLRMTVAGCRLIAI